MRLKMRLPVPLCLVVAMACLSMTGCVRRRVTINSYPHCDLVKVDGKDIGYTPASFDFTWYGTREVKLLKDGFVAVSLRRERARQ